MVKGFSKMYNLSFFGHIFFANIFTIKLDFAQKNSIFANLQIFKLTPPSVSWFSSTPAGIGLNCKRIIKQLSQFSNKNFFFRNCRNHKTSPFLPLKFKPNARYSPIKSIFLGRYSTVYC